MGDESRVRAVVDLAQRMAAAQALPDVALAAAEGARLALRASFAAVSVWERERGRLRVLVNAGELAEGEERFPRDESYPVHDYPEITEFLSDRWGLSGRWDLGDGLARGGGEPRAWVETADGPRASRRVRGLRARGRGSCVVAPLVLNGRAWGELYVARGTGAEPLGRADADFASVLASAIGAGLVQYERLAEARRLAYTDPLTGLANRRAVDIRLEEALERHRATGAVVTLVVCDVNGLKGVNDTYGHATGDRLLERFGSVLSRCAAGVPGALAARLGGDEFCLLAVGAGAGVVERAAEEICHRAAELELGEGVACGVASTGEAIGPVRSARGLFRLADAAQYEAKASRALLPVVAGRGGAGDAAVALAEAAVAEGAERRTIRGRGPH
ncbi:diguanylate cyclase domain-containing protein [Streptomyces sp. MS19]|uniref:GGDEF domain-containing protein n=1 Tax=Streptomyces sp. MS19 TaxID=3385972 RepID=UPI00399F0FB6